MKKIFIVLLTILMLTSLINFVFAATAYELDEPYGYEYFEVGTNGDNIKVSINNDYGKNLFITMKIGDPNVDKVILFINGNRSETIPIEKHDTDYWIDIDLNSIKGDKAYISIVLQRGTKMTISGAGTIEFGIVKKESRWKLDIDENIVKHNQKLFKNINSPSESMGNVSQKIIDVSNSIVGNETDPRKIVLLIYDWVCNNIYYDRVGTIQETSPEKILEYKYTMCTGYSSIMQALLKAQNIPCNIVYGYVYGIAVPGGTERTIPIEGANEISGYSHAWNEAYIDGEWMLLDSTWDSLNIYNGDNNFVKSEYPPAHSYYDPSLVYFSNTHVIDNRGITALQNKDNPSSWAINEVTKAIDMNIIPTYLQNNYTQGITRKEFASLIVASLKKDMGSILFIMDLDNSIKYDDNIFSDTVDPDVIMASMLNIVSGKGNGKFAPDDLITREEAAVMLYRTAKKMRYYDGWNIKKSSFSDQNQIANWAKEAVDFVSSAIDNVSKNHIMGGVGNNAFNPNGIYTREQAFITFGRLFNMTFNVE